MFPIFWKGIPLGHISENNRITGTLTISIVFPIISLLTADPTHLYPLRAIFNLIVPSVQLGLPRTGLTRFSIGRQLATAESLDKCDLLDIPSGRLSFWGSPRVGFPKYRRIEKEREAMCVLFVLGRNVVFLHYLKHLPVVYDEAYCCCYDEALCAAANAPNFAVFKRMSLPNDPLISLPFKLIRHCPNDALIFFTFPVAKRQRNNRVFCRPV